MSISIQCPDCGWSVACETGTMTIGSFLTCGACGHSFQCLGRELRAALNNVEKRIQEVPRPLQDEVQKKPLPD